MGGGQPSLGPRDGPRRHSVPAALVYALAFAYLLAKAASFLARVPPGVPPDEPAHVSFVAYERAERRLLPRYEEMRLLDDAGRFGELPNYLSHPALYYAVVGGLAGMAGEPENQPLEALTRRLRRASVPLFVAAAALFVHLGWRRPWSLAGHVVYAAAVSTVPAFAFLGGAVNNDVLAFLSGGIALLGLARRLEGRSDRLTATLLGAGLALALLSKATAGLLVSVAVLGALVVTRDLVPPAKRGRFALAVLAGFLLPAVHFVPVLLRYGTPIPSLDVTNPEAFARSAFVVPGGGELLSLPEWGVSIARLLASTWLSITGHVWLPVGPAFTLGGPLLLLALAALGLAARERAGAGGDGADRELALVGAGALAVTLLVNLAYAREGYLETGRLGGVHARYYLPLLPCLGVAAATGLRRLAAGPWLAALLAALLLLADVGVTVRYLRLFPVP